MEWLYLVLSLGGLALTGVVWWPPKGLAGFWGFLVGWLYGELALHHVALQVLLSFGFLAVIGLDSAPARLALLLSVASWSALVLHWGTSFRSLPRVEEALVRSLGPGYRERIAPHARAQLRASFDWPRIAWPFSPRRGRQVVREANVPFAQVGGRQLRLDVYRPTEEGTARPVLLQIHGGAWTVGTKDNQALPLMYHLAERGWICVASSYRLSPKATFPEHLIDCKRALAWIRSNIADYGGDPDFVVTTGGSAGGHLSALLALTPNEPEYQPGFEDVDTRVQGCVPFYGVYDWTGGSQQPQHAPMARLLAQSVMKKRLDEDLEGYRRASPMWRIGSSAPPFLVVQGDCDSLVAVEDARVFSDRLEKATDSPVAYLEVVRGQHAFDIFDGVRTQLAVNAAERFCAAIHGEHVMRR